MSVGKTKDSSAAQSTSKSPATQQSQTNKHDWFVCARECACREGAGCCEGAGWLSRTPFFALPSRARVRKSARSVAPSSRKRQYISYASEINAPGRETIGGVSGSAPVDELSAYEGLCLRSHAKRSLHFSKRFASDLPCSLGSILHTCYLRRRPHRSDDRPNRECTAPC